MESLLIFWNYFHLWLISQNVSFRVSCHEKVFAGKILLSIIIIKIYIYIVRIHAK